MKKVFMVLLIALLAFSSTSLWAAAAAEKAPEGPVKIVYWRSLTGVRGRSTGGAGCPLQRISG